MILPENDCTPFSVPDSSIGSWYRALLNRPHPLWVSLNTPFSPGTHCPFFGLVWLDSILIKEMFSSFNCASSNACMKVVGLSSSTPPQLSSFRPTMKNSTKKSSGRLGIWLDNVQTLFGSKKWFTFVVANPVGALNWRMSECPHLRLTLV